MYQVIVMYGPDEPWWFFEGWEEAIREEFQFDDFAMAQAKFFELNNKLQQENEFWHEKTPASFLIAYWNEDDFAYCEECDEDLQQYTGLLLVENCRALNDSDAKENEQVHSCRIK